MSMDAPATINFFKGHPTFRLLPNKEIVEATRQLLTPSSRAYDDDTSNRHPLTYGSNEGALWVRQTICQFMNDEAFKLNPADTARSLPKYLNLNSGASYGVLSILLQTTLPHTGYTKQAFIITPTYFLINDCFIDAGFGGKMTAIDELNDNGEIDLGCLVEKLDYFEEQGSDETLSTDIVNNPLKDHKKKIYRYVLYCIPTYSNPSGKTYSLKTRKALLRIARKYDMLIITDDVYDLLNYNEPMTQVPTPKKRLVHLDRETNKDPESFGHSISNATFSKLIAPGLRFGYHESINNKLVSQLSQGGANVSGGTPSQLNSMIVGTLLQNGAAQKILATLRKTYAERMRVLKEAVDKYLPANTECNLPGGGYFVWITLPVGYDAATIGEALSQEHGIILANGSEFEVVGDMRGWGQRSARLSISYLESKDIEKGIKLWGEICKKYKN